MSEPSASLVRRSAGQTGGPRLHIRLALLVGVVLAATAVLVVTTTRDTLVYYKTPSELVADSSLAGERVRVGGLVLDGSVHYRHDGGVSFTLTDGVTRIRVTYPDQPRGVFQEGQNALVGGVWQGKRPLRADEVMVKHSNEYRGPGRGYTPPAIDEGTVRP